MKMIFFHQLCFNYTSGKTLSIKNYCDQTLAALCIFSLHIKYWNIDLLLNFYFESFYICNEQTMMVFLYEINGTTSATEVYSLFFHIILDFYILQIMHTFLYTTVYKLDSVIICFKFHWEKQPPKVFSKKRRS